MAGSAAALGGTVAPDAAVSMAGAESVGVAAGGGGLGRVPAGRRGRGFTGGATAAPRLIGAIESAGMLGAGAGVVVSARSLAGAAAWSERKSRRAPNSQME